MKKFMKAFCFLLLLFFYSYHGYSQNTPTAPLRLIEVTGSAEINMKPDEIELSFKLQEYKKKATKETVRLKEIEAEFYTILKKFGLTEKDVILNDNLYGVDWYSWIRNRKTDLKYKEISVTMNKSVNVQELLKTLDKEWMDDISISKSSNKNEQTFRKELKISAMKAAKEKATYLLAAIGEEPGKVFSVEEVEANTNQRLYSSSSNTVSMHTSTDDVDNIGTIKLRYEIKVKFEIK